MHGLILRSVQNFVVDVFGRGKWSNIVDAAELDFDDFEGLLVYDDDVGARVFAALYGVLNRPAEDVLEDLGMYMVSHPNTERLRRLLRFGGANFEDFLHSLDDLPERARLAMSNLHLPQIELKELTLNHFTVICRGAVPGTGHVLVGMLRGMADDYGALALVEFKGAMHDTETVTISLLEKTFSEGRAFNLAGQAV